MNWKKVEIKLNYQHQNKPLKELQHFSIDFVNTADNRNFSTDFNSIWIWSLKVNYLYSRRRTKARASLLPWSTVPVSITTHIRIFLLHMCSQLGTCISLPPFFGHHCYLLSMFRITEAMTEYLEKYAFRTFSSTAHPNTALRDGKG